MDLMAPLIAVSEAPWRRDGEAPMLAQDAQVIAQRRVPHSPQTPTHEGESGCRMLVLSRRIA